MSTWGRHKKYSRMQQSELLNYGKPQKIAPS